MSPKDEKYFIFGDIEENEYVLNDVFECIEKNKNASFIFLGDIYTPKSSKKSIQNISKIFDILDIACYDYIGELIDKNNKYKTLSNIRHIFNRLYICLNLNIYNKVNKIKQTYEIYDTIQKCDNVANSFTFLIGNKEIDLIHDMMNFDYGTINEKEQIIKTVFSYYFKGSRHTNEFYFTYDEMNVLINYLVLCKNYVIINNILLSHMYANAKTLLTYFNVSDNIKYVISGHNRCFGIYYDVYNTNVDIYMLDLTHEDYETVNVKNYLTIYKNKISFTTSNEIVKKMLKIKLPANDFFLKGVIDSTNDICSIEYFRRCSAFNNEIYNK